MRWVEIDTGAVLSDETKPYGSRTQGTIVRCQAFGDAEVKWAARVLEPSVKQTFPDKESAARWVEVVVGLR